MKLFTCAHCQNVLYFENTRCERCRNEVGYAASRNRIELIRPAGKEKSRPAWRRCANAAHDACNWLLAADDPAALCEACRNNGVIPPLDPPDNVALWQRVQRAKHRLIYTLRRLGLPHAPRGPGNPEGLVFDVLADPPDDSGPKVMTGHDNGRITLALAEADDAERERRRADMGEPYRSLLGHVRHEVGHFYWNVLVRDAGRLEESRTLFGDETEDYAAALQRHYDHGAPPDWQERHVSAYAAAHPWEDFAETFAHYLHIMDTLETAASFGLRVQPRVASPDADTMSARVDFDPYGASDFGQIMEAWLPVTHMANNLNRSMGQPDLYPFVLSQAVQDKLDYVHRLVRAAHRDARANAA